MSNLLTMTEAATELDVTRQYIHQLILSEQLQAIWMLGRWAVPESEVKRIKRKRRRQAKPTNGNGRK